MIAMNESSIAIGPVPVRAVPPSRARPVESAGTPRVASARPTYEPILRASQAGGLCALMDELRRLGALGPAQREKARGSIGEVSE